MCRHLSFSFLFILSEKMSDSIENTHETDNGPNTEVTFNSIDALILFPTTIIIVFLLLTAFTLNLCINLFVSTIKHGFTYVRNCLKK